MISKNDEVRTGIDYKFLIILVLLLIICGLEIFRTYKMNKFSHINRSGKMIERPMMMNNKNNIKFQNTKGHFQNTQQPMIMQDNAPNQK